MGVSYLDKKYTSISIHKEVVIPHHAIALPCSTCKEARPEEYGMGVRTSARTASLLSLMQSAHVRVAAEASLMWASPGLRILRLLMALRGSPDLRVRVCAPIARSLARTST